MTIRTVRMTHEEASKVLSNWGWIDGWPTIEGGDIGLPELVGAVLSLRIVRAACDDHQRTHDRVAASILVVKKGGRR